MDKYTVLKHHFGYASFRGGQERLIDAVLDGRDVLGIMPTGGGKSLCYQIPALLLPGMTVVVSPLISLMKDQVMALKNAGVAAAYVNSSLTGEQLARVYDNIRRGVYKLLYIAPERLQSDGFAELARRLPIALLAVDEAHCISQWGNDFRPSYLRIADFIRGLPTRPVVAAFTATATEQVRRDIEEKLEMRAPLRVVTGFDRPNLRFEVLRPRQRPAALLELVEKRRGKSGIIYCLTRSNVEKVCALLRAHGVPATRYHAGLSDAERQRNQEDFVYDRCPVIAATNAFGMGIDKSNVSYVIHYNMPMSLEAYYQEAGRAGRDGAPAECLLLYARSDVQTAKMLIDSTEGDAADGETRETMRRRAYARLDRMLAYCKTTKCLRGCILDYFGQAHGEACGNCGNCQTVFRQADITVEAQKILSCVKRVQDRLGYPVGAALIARVLHGSGERRIVRLGLQTLSTYGLMRGVPLNQIGERIDFLLDCGYLEKNTAFGALTLAEKARGVLFGGEAVTMEYRESPTAPDEGRGAPTAQAADAGLYERLRALRLAVATEQGVPAYIVFSNATLADMAARRPTDAQAFTEVFGVGSAKAALYGERFLAEIRAYLDDGGDG